MLITLTLCIYWPNNPVAFWQSQKHIGLHVNRQESRHACTHTTAILTHTNTHTGTYAHIQALEAHTCCYTQKWLRRVGISRPRTGEASSSIKYIMELEQNLLSSV